jgi:hypothetical protein
MANFIIAAKKKDGSDYEPTSLRGIISSIDRKLRRHRYGHYIGGDEKHTKFPPTKETLKTKMKLLKKQGKGNKPNRAQPITDSELDILYESNLLSGSSPEALLKSKWFNNSADFGLRGVKEHYQLRYINVILFVTPLHIRFSQLTLNKCISITLLNIP